MAIMAGGFRGADSMARGTSSLASRPIHFHQQFAQVEQGLGIARVLAQLHQVVLSGLVQLALAAERLGDAEVHLGPVLVQVQRFLPAIECLVEQPPVVEAHADVVEAVGAILLVLAGEVEHLLGPVVVAEWR